MGRIFHISNRVDIPIEGVATAGGLDEAIADAPEGYTTVRFGWSGNTFKEKDKHFKDTVKITNHKNGVKYITFDLHESDLDRFYNFVANGIVWPACHYRDDIAKAGFATEIKTETDHYGAQEAIRTYYRLNREFAELASEYIEYDDTVIAHDFHLIPMGKHLAISNPVGFFFHIPMLDAQALRTYSRPQQNFFTELFKNLHHYDMVGLQTPNDVVALKSLIGHGHTAINKAPSFYETMPFDKTPNIRGRIPQFGSFPVAGNASKYVSLAKRWENHPDTKSYIEENANGELDMMSVERRDYSKGLVPKVMGVARWLRDFGQAGERIHLVQVAPKGREAVRAYQDESLKIETAVETINEVFGECVKLDGNKMDRGPHLGLARHSKAALITPLKDGMNLYIGEYLAAQDGRDEPGVAIVSKFAGAASIYNGALVQVNPLESRSIAEGIQEARQAGKGQRQDMLGRAQEIQKEFTNTKWQTSLVQATQAAASTPEPKP